MITILESVIHDLTAGDSVALKNRMTPKMALFVTDNVMTSLQSTLRAIGSLISIEWESKDGGEGYFTAHMQHGDVHGLIALSADGKISGLKFDPLPNRLQNLSYVTRGVVQLPFRGEWYAVSGGIDPSKNNHAGVAPQEYAYDFLILHDGKTHKGKGHANSDYYAYGQPVLSPVTGTVVNVVDGVLDNLPGIRNAYYIPGNTVVVDNHQGEWALIAHLQPYRISVHLGQKVSVGDIIGYCGNSGNSTEPHIHFHIQSSPDISSSEGLPITFTSFREDGVLKVRAVGAGHVHLSNG